MSESEDLISRTSATVQQLLREIEQLPANILYKEPRTGEWPVMSTLAHLTELLPYWAHEAADVAQSPGKPFGRALDDPRRTGAIEQHGHDTIADIVPRIRSALDECESTLRAIPAGGWSAVGQHPSRGPMSAAQIVEAFVCNHAAEHAKQIRETLQTLRAG